MSCVAALQFVPGDPRVTGTWDDEAAAEQRFLSWVGLYDGHPTAVITLAEVTVDGREHILREWPEKPATVGSR
ncbi:hypothetical protein ABZ926_14845 [Streptomyces litmocidini]|uniref:hypothetical protein n=1 Tax=Streptomyces litmocidini TaxID=67318 RepID=UPI0033EEEE57